MFEDIKKMLVDELTIDESAVTPDAELVNDLGLNSLEIADLIVLCEEKYEISFDEEQARNFVTVSDVAGYVENLVAEK